MQRRHLLLLAVFAVCFPACSVFCPSTDLKPYNELAQSGLAVTQKCQQITAQAGTQCGGNTADACKTNIAEAQGDCAAAQKDFQAIIDQANSTK